MAALPKAVAFPPDALADAPKADEATAAVAPEPTAVALLAWALAL
jgi:hypothetical protein